MEFLLKQSLKLISYEFSNGLLFSELCQKLKAFFQNISFSEQDLLKKLIENSQEFKLSITNQETENPKFISHKSLVDKYTKQNVLSLFISDEEEKREVIIKIYEIIVKSRENGISYIEIKKKLKKQINLDLEINMISHYCCKLASCDLVQITPTKTCKIVVSQIFLPSKIQKTIKNNVENKETSNENKEEKSFNFRELTFKQNILVNLMGAESHLKNGLSLIELGERIGKQNESKMLNRYLTKIEKDYSIQIIPERQGRLYSHKYLIENEQIKQELKKLQDDCSEKQIIHGKEQFPKKSPLSESTPKEIALNKNANQQKIQELFVSELKKQENQLLNESSFKDLAKIFIENSDFCNILEKTTEPHIFQYFKKIKIALNNNNIHESLKIIPKGDYQLLTENLIKILIEKIEFDIIKKQKLDLNNSKSKKQVSKLKINRYIICLNEIYQEEVLFIQKLKQKLISFESDYGIGKIDRKTVLFMLESLEEIGVIKLIQKDFDKPENTKKISSNSSNFQKKNRNIILMSHISESDKRIENLFLSLIPKTPTKTSQEKVPILENSKKISKKKKKNIQMKEEEKEKLEKLWLNSIKKEEDISNSNPNGDKKSFYSYFKVEDSEIKKTIFHQTLVKLCEKLKKKQIKYTWRKLINNMELKDLEEALNKITKKETSKNNFYTFSRKFDDLNKWNLYKVQKAPKNKEVHNLNYDEILNNIDKNIEIYESAMEIEEDFENNASNLFINENSRKNEKNIERLKNLLIKYPFKKMKDLEVQLNNINYINLIWKELLKQDFIRILKINEDDGSFLEIDNGDLKNKEDFYYQVKERFYEYI